MLPSVPRCSGWASSSLTSSQPCQHSSEWQPGQPAHRHFRGLLGVHSRCGLHTCVVTIRDALNRRLRTFCYLHARSDCFRLERCRRAGLAPAGKRRLVTAHANCCHWWAPRHRLEWISGRNVLGRAVFFEKRLVAKARTRRKLLAKSSARKQAKKRADIDRPASAAEESRVPV